MHKRGGKRKGAGRPRTEPSSTVRVPEGCLAAVKDLIANYKKGNNTYEIVTNNQPLKDNFRHKSPKQILEEQQMKDEIENRYREILEDIKKQYEGANRLSRRTLLKRYGTEEKVIEALYLEAVSENDHSRFGNDWSRGA